MDRVFQIHVKIEIDEIDQINQLDQIDEIDQKNQMDRQIDRQIDRYIGKKRTAKDRKGWERKEKNRIGQIGQMDGDMDR